jgi:uncharacterized membrane protein (UPF0127 family)
MKNILTKLFYLFLITVVTFSCQQWFEVIQEVDIDNDEVAWVLDAGFYEYYRNGDWEKFQVKDDYQNLKWSSHQYRVIDQPQLGKYILGFMLSAADIKPWLSADKIQGYNFFLFSDVELSDLEREYPQFYETVMAAIMLVRKVNAVVALLGFAALGFLVKKFTREKWAGVVIFLLLVWHPTIHHYYRLAIVNPYSLWLQLLAVVAMAYELRILQKKNGRQLIKIGAVTGGLIAAATSVKLNGAFLVLIPIFFGGIVAALSLRKKHSESFNYFFTKWLYFFGSLIFSGEVMFLLLEPELWFNPINGLLSLVESRLGQQDRFFVSHPELNIFETIEFIWNLTPTWIGQNMMVSLVFFLLIICGVWSLIKKILSFKLKKKANQDLTSLLLLTSLFTIIGGTLYYARVGFDRYALPSVFSFLILATIGMVEIYETIITMDFQFIKRNLFYFKKSLFIFLVIIASGFLAGCDKLIPRAIDENMSQISQQKNENNVVKAVTQNTFSDREKIAIKIGDQQLQVEVVNTPQSITQGLSGRTEISSDGMLFIFPDLQERSFWMKEMKFDLDLVWIKHQKVIGVSEQVPKPATSTPLFLLKKYPSPGIVDMVLELPAGKAAALNIGLDSILSF